MWSHHKGVKKMVDGRLTFFITIYVYIYIYTFFEKYTLSTSLCFFILFIIYFSVLKSESVSLFFACRVFCVATDVMMIALLLLFL